MTNSNKESWHHMSELGPYWLTVNNEWLARQVVQVAPAMAGHLREEFDGRTASYGANICKVGSRMYISLVSKEYVRGRDGSNYHEIRVVVAQTAADGKIGKQHALCIARKRPEVLADTGKHVYFAAANAGVPMSWVIGPQGMSHKSFLSWLKIKVCRVYGEVLNAGLDAGATSAEMNDLRQRLANMQSKLRDAEEARDLHFAARQRLEAAESNRQTTEKAWLLARGTGLAHAQELLGEDSVTMQLIRDNLMMQGRLNVDLASLAVHMKEVPAMRDWAIDVRINWVERQFHRVFVQLAQMIETDKPKEGKGRRKMVM